MVGMEVDGNSVSLTRLEMTGLGSRGAQHPPATPNRHAFPQGDLGWHGKSQFHDRPFRQHGIGVKENSTPTQVLSKSRHSPFIKVNRQRQVHFETLRASSFKTMFQTMLKTISICAHRSSSPDTTLSHRSALTLSPIAPTGKFQVRPGHLFCVPSPSSCSVPSSPT